MIHSVFLFSFLCKSCAESVYVIILQIRVFLRLAAAGTVHILRASTPMTFPAKPSHQAPPKPSGLITAVILNHLVTLETVTKATCFSNSVLSEIARKRKDVATILSMAYGERTGLEHGRALS